MKFFRGVLIATPISILFWLLIIKLCFGAVYYVDSEVTDTNAASCTPDFTTYNPSTFATTGGASSVFKTIADVNACDATGLPAGSYVYFRKGQIWRETLTVPSSGSAGLPITFGAYGTGANPIISGAEIITSWSPSVGVGNNGTTIPAGTTKVSDEITFTFDKTKRYLIHIYSETRNGRLGSTAFQLWYKSSAPAGDVTTAAVSYTSYALGGARCVSKLEVWDGSQWRTAWTPAEMDTDLTGGSESYRLQIAAGVSSYDGTKVRISIPARAGANYTVDGTSIGESTANDDFDAAPTRITWDASATGAYQATVTTEPKVVMYNGVMLTPNDGAGTAVALNEWDWAANVLYVNVGEDPDVGVLEAGQRAYAFDFNTRSYVTLDGFTLTGANTYTVRASTSGSNVIIQNNTIYNSFQGVWITSSDGSFSILNNTIHDLLEYGVMISSSGASGFIVTGNTIYNIGTPITGTDTNMQGILFDTSGIIVANNTIYNIGNTAALDAGSHEQGIYAGGTGASIYKNLIHDISGCGIKLTTVTNSNIYYNVVYEAGYAGIRLETNSTGNNVYNNVMYNNGVGTYGSGGLNIASGSNNSTVKNNIMSANIGVVTSHNQLIVDAGVTGLTANNNLYYHATEVHLVSYDGSDHTWAEWQAHGFEANGVNSDPLFINAAGGDFTLQSTSPARDAGTAVTLSSSSTYFGYVPGTISGYTSVYAVGKEHWTKNGSAVSIGTAGTYYVTSLEAYVKSGGGSPKHNIRLGLYTNGADYQGTLVCSGTAEVSVSSTDVGWVGHVGKTNITPNPCTIDGETTYKLYFTVDGADPTFAYRTGAGHSPYFYSSNDRTGGLSSTLPFSSSEWVQWYIRAGYELASLYQDYSGRRVPYNTTPDIGAHEYGVGSGTLGSGTANVNLGSSGGTITLGN